MGQQESKKFSVANKNPSLINNDNDNDSNNNNKRFQVVNPLGFSQ